MLNIVREGGTDERKPTFMNENYFHKLYSFNSKCLLHSDAIQNLGSELASLFHYSNYRFTQDMLDTLHIMKGIHINSYGINNYSIYQKNGLEKMSYDG